MSPLASADPAEEQANTAQGEKTFYRRAGSTAQVFSYGKWHFPEVELVYLGVLIPPTVFLKNKTECKMVGVLFKSV